MGPRAGLHALAKREVPVSNPGCPFRTQSLYLQKIKLYAVLLKMEVKPIPDASFTLNVGLGQAMDIVQ